VSNPVVTAVVGGRGEFGSTKFIFYAKHQFQAPAVAATANEAVVPICLQLIHMRSFSA
jgi:hypothetical protein